MGCDIHLFTERKRHIDEVEVWVNCDNWKLNHYYNANDPGGESEYNINSICDDRDYRLFSILADVRNNSDNLVISSPKGLPPDVSKHTKSESDDWDCDGHSHSYFTLSELKAFRKENGTTKYSGLMTPENAAKVDAGEMPDSWCQGTTYTHYVSREWEREGSPLDDLIEALDGHMRKEFWIWDDKDHPDKEEKIRIVFWFDN